MMTILAIVIFVYFCGFIGFLFGEYAHEKKIIDPPEFYVQQKEDGHYYVYPIPKTKESH